MYGSKVLTLMEMLESGEDHDVAFPRVDYVPGEAGYGSKVYFLKHLDEQSNEWDHLASFTLCYVQKPPL